MAITNREEAIKVACTLAKSGDILLVAGKGHEKYQEIKGVRFPFDDLSLLVKTLKNLNK
jgi:UDP-N-acetylmuramoyl-L-alanyl-D-glutamate--2,6-diaminopimelate ligase